MRRVGGIVAGSDKAETKSKGVDIVYSGRGMPFRVVCIITLLGKGKGGRCAVVPFENERELRGATKLCRREINWNNVSDVR